MFSCIRNHVNHQNNTDAKVEGSVANVGHRKGISVQEIKLSAREEQGGDMWRVYSWTTMQVHFEFDYRRCIRLFWNRPVRHYLCCLSQRHLTSLRSLSLMTVPCGSVGLLSSPALSNTEVTETFLFTCALSRKVHWEVHLQGEHLFLLGNFFFFLYFCGSSEDTNMPKAVSYYLFEGIESCI